MAMLGCGVVGGAAIASAPHDKARAGPNKRRSVNTHRATAESGLASPASMHHRHAPPQAHSTASPPPTGHRAARCIIPPGDQPHLGRWQWVTSARSGPPSLLAQRQRQGCRGVHHAGPGSGQGAVLYFKNPINSFARYLFSNNLSNHDSPSLLFSIATSCVSASILSA